MTVHEAAGSMDARMTAAADPGQAQAPPGSAAPGRGPMIATLTGVRALAGVWVVLDHFQLAVAALLPALRILTPPLWTYHCVEMFAILSGFIVAYNYTEKVRSAPGYRKYLWGRFVRTYPAYLITLVVAGCLALAYPSDFRALSGQDFPYTTGNLVGNIFLMGSVPGFRPINGTSWFVGCVFAAYLVFPVLAWWARRLSPRAALGSAVGVLTVGVVLVIMSAPRSIMWIMAPHEMWLRIATEFTAGVLLCTWWRAKPRRSVRWDITAICVVVAVVALSYVAPRDNPASFLAMPLIALFVVSCASASGPVARLLSSRPMQWGGKVAYSVILVHGITYLVFEQIVRWQDLVDAGLVVRIGWLVVFAMWIVGSAAALHYFIDMPVRRRLLSWYAARHPTKAKG